jgi:hypothetical protein
VLLLWLNKELSGCLIRKHNSLTCSCLAAVLRGFHVPSGLAGAGPLPKLCNAYLRHAAYCGRRVLFIHCWRFAMAFALSIDFVWNILFHKDYQQLIPSRQCPCDFWELDRKSHRKKLLGAARILLQSTESLLDCWIPIGKCVYKDS